MSPPFVPSPPQLEEGHWKKVSPPPPPPCSQLHHILIQHLAAEPSGGKSGIQLFRAQPPPNPPQLLLVFLEAGLILGKLCTKLNRTTVENIDLIWETVELMI